MTAKSGTLYVTYIETEGRFLKVWGQTDRKLAATIERSLMQVSPQFDQGLCIPSIPNIKVGMLLCAKYKEGLYYRVRVLNTNRIHQGIVDVQSIDYGYRNAVPILNLRVVSNFAPGLESVPPQAIDFLLANATHTGSTWERSIIAAISNEVQNTELGWLITSQFESYTLIKLFKDGMDIVISLCKKGALLPIAAEAQHKLLQNSPPVTSVVPTPMTAETLSTPAPSYKAFTLKVGSENDIFVSYVMNGPCLFSIQLQQFEVNLARLMNELNSMDLQPLEEDPLPGTTCVTRCLEDEHICRAVVTSLIDCRYKVYYVDFGNSEVVPIQNMFQIPFKYTIPKAMAIRYCLAGIEKSSVTLEMKCIFKDFVSDKLLRMRALPQQPPSLVPQCILWDQNGTNVLDVLKKAATLAYPEIIQLTRGCTQEIRVSYVYSCSHFYIQLRSKEESLRKIMSELQVECVELKPLELSQLRVGLPCCSLFSADGQWYRAEVLNITADKIKVRYVDYGNEDTVTADNLRSPPADLLTALRPQAIECCLNGYQNMENDLERDNILEELILEKEFTLKVVEMQGNRALVDLIDSARYNVGSLLLEKLACARSQVSPLLIQDSNQIEHRKKRSPGDSGRNNSTNYGSEQKPMRNQSDRKPRNSQESWRQSRSQPRKEDSELNNSDNFSKGSGRREGFRKHNGRDGNNESEGNWKRNQKSPNSQKYSSVRRDGSEKSYSDGSEKNWRRTSRTNNFSSNNEDRKPRRTKHESTGVRSSSVNDNIVHVTDPAPYSATFSVSQLIGQNEKITISWFHNPSHFFCQLFNSRIPFADMMEDIQRMYSNVKQAQGVPVGAPVIALFPDDNVMYRARVLEIIGSQYRVQYVDFGNVSITNKIWPIENKFMELPAQAISCSLNGLVPVKEKWDDPDAFSLYFEKEFFTCFFTSMSSENQNYMVELSSDEKSINQALVAGGLAKYDETKVEYDSDFDNNILLGQQMTVIIGEVQSLDKFYVKLQNGIQILSTMHNLTSATETFEDTLKQAVGSAVIMYVDNVLQESLEVTLYDLSGTKMIIIQPDEGAYDTADIPCPFPLYSSQMQGWITAIISGENDKSTVFIQPSEYSEIISQLLESLYNHYESIPTEDSLQVEVDLIYAVHSSDSNWYRGRATAVEDQNVTISFVDYGNSETVPISEVRTLASEFLQQHFLAMQVSVAGIDESFINQDVNANIWYGDDGWEAKIHLLSQPNSILSNKTEKTDPEKIEEHSPDTNNQQPEVETFDVVDQGVPIILSHIDSPNEFYVQLVEELETIDNLQAVLQEQVPSFPLLENPAAGVLCVAPYSVDQMWYRAQVLDADSDITTVRFVDYGNTDVLTNSTTEIKTLPPELLALEQHARRCSLIVKSNEAEWSPVACERFENLTNYDQLSVKIFHQDEKTTYVELYANGLNVGETLRNEGLAVEAEFETESSCTGYASHINSPSEFWIQLENSVTDLELIIEQLSAAEKFPELEDLTPGSLCAALYPDDEMWYRARILSNTVAGIEVLFIDYGNSRTCTGLRQLPENLIMLPALAQKCSLQKPAGILQWSIDAIEKFGEIAADGATIFNICKISTGETSVVQLLLNGEDIVTNFLPKTEGARISHLESLSSFWLQKTEDASKLHEITEKLYSAIGWPNYKQSEDESSLIAALNADDDMWYRARILNSTDSGSYTVQLIDYGKIMTTSAVRALASETEQQPPLANKYKLEPLPGQCWSDDSFNKFTDIIKDGTTTFQVEFVNGDAVRLYLNGSDIRSDLGSIPITSTHSTPKKAYTYAYRTQEVVKNTLDFSDDIVGDTPSLNADLTEQPLLYDEEEKSLSTEISDEIQNEHEQSPDSDIITSTNNKDDQSNEIVTPNNLVSNNVINESQNSDLIHSKESDHTIIDPDLDKKCEMISDVDASTNDNFDDVNVDENADIKISVDASTEPNVLNKLQNSKLVHSEESKQITEHTDDSNKDEVVCDIGASTGDNNATITASADVNSEDNIESQNSNLIHPESDNDCKVIDDVSTAINDSCDDIDVETNATITTSVDVSSDDNIESQNSNLIHPESDNDCKVVGDVGASTGDNDATIKTSADVSSEDNIESQNSNLIHPESDNECKVVGDVGAAINDSCNDVDVETNATITTSADVSSDDNIESQNSNLIHPESDKECKVVGDVGAAINDSCDDVDVEKNAVIKTSADVSSDDNIESQNPDLIHPESNNDCKVVGDVGAAINDSCDDVNVEKNAVIKTSDDVSTEVSAASEDSTLAASESNNVPLAVEKKITSVEQPSLTSQDLESEIVKDDRSDKTTNDEEVITAVASGSVDDIKAAANSQKEKVQVEEIKIEDASLEDASHADEKVVEVSGAVPADKTPDDDVKDDGINTKDCAKS